MRSQARFKVARAGRKGGKTIGEVEIISYKAAASVKRLSLTKSSFPTGRKVIYIAPTQLQARTIIWEALKKRWNGIGVPNEQLLQMKVPNEDGDTTTIFVGGWENRENYRGWADVIHITFDEVDTLKDFFLAWREIFRPMFMDTGGTADFIGTPKKESQNLRRLEKEAEGDPNWATFHFTSFDNPYLDRSELDLMKQEYTGDPEAYKQEVLAEYVDNLTALFRYDCLIDMFTNTVDKGSKYLTVDVADDGSDKTVFAFWDGMECYDIQTFKGLQTENIITEIREAAAREKIPLSHIAVDAVGVGAGVASSSLLTGIVGFKGSYSAIRNEPTIFPTPVSTVRPVMLTDFKNLRSQCMFHLASLVNQHKIAVKIQDTRLREQIIEELSAYQDVSKGDGKKMVTPKEDVKDQIGRSPDVTDTLQMRMYFEIRAKVMPEFDKTFAERMENHAIMRRDNMALNSTM